MPWTCPENCHETGDHFEVAVSTEVHDEVILYFSPKVSPHFIKALQEVLSGLKKDKNLENETHNKVYAGVTIERDEPECSLCESRLIWVEGASDDA